MEKSKQMWKEQERPHAKISWKQWKHWKQGRSRESLGRNRARGSGKFGKCNLFPALSDAATTQRKGEWNKKQNECDQSHSAATNRQAHQRPCSGRSCVPAFRCRYFRRICPSRASDRARPGAKYKILNKKTKERSDQANLTSRRVHDRKGRQARGGMGSVDSVGGFPNRREHLPAGSLFLAALFLFHLLWAVISRVILILRRLIHPMFFPSNLTRQCTTRAPGGKYGGWVQRGKERRVCRGAYMRQPVTLKGNDVLQMHDRACRLALLERGRRPYSR